MPADFLLELGSEELPATFVEPALEFLSTEIKKGLDEARLKHGEVKKYGTPRRLAIHIIGVADSGEDIKKDVQGPSVKAAFGPDGKPTVPATKFAESVGLPVEKLSRVTTAKGEYLAATKEEKGKKAAEIFPSVLHAAVHAIRFPKSMRWSDVDLTWGRPLHWIVALLGAEVVPVIYSDVKSGRVTHGHRFLSPAAIELSSPGDYLPALLKANVIADPKARRAKLAEEVHAAAKKAGGKLREDESLLDQVNMLVELPCPVIGCFETRHLDLPEEVLISEMKSHQRYFAVENPGGGLLPSFIAVSNTRVKDEPLSIKGYERVLKSRLTDGRYFFDTDKKTKLADETPRLERVLWKDGLGSYANKVERIRKLVSWLAGHTGHAELRPTLDRAGELCKADLVTGMVGEFPELQGVMGREYALASGETEAVAKTIFEHYLPRNAADALPSTDAGALLGLADRLDTLIGIFGIGEIPTGAKDPFALRRAALAVINVVLSRKLRFHLDLALAESVNLYRHQGIAKAKGGKPFGESGPVRDFISGRLESLWGESTRVDLVKAVLAVHFGDLVQMRLRLDALAQMVKGADFTPLAATFKRVANIVAKNGKDVAAGAVDPALLKDAEEKALYEAFQKLHGEVDALFKKDEFTAGLAKLATLRPTVDTFFDKVMVISDDVKVKENRVRLLMSISELFRAVGDFAQIQAE